MEFALHAVCMARDRRTEVKRSDIKAGVVYAVHSSYGSPSPVVFLQDAAAGLFQRQRGGLIKDYTGQKWAKAHQGRGWSSYSMGYAAVKPSRAGSFNVESGGMSHQARIQALHGLDTAAELQLFKEGKDPSVAGVEFEIVSSLGKIRGEYEAESIAYDAAQAAERLSRERKDAASQARRDRTQAAANALAKAAGAWADEEEFSDLARFSAGLTDRPGRIAMSVEDAERLAALLFFLKARSES
jgi:hypothetical protein